MRILSNTLITLLVVLFIPLITFAEGNVAQGKENFAQFCAQCHGPNGAGDGPVGASLPASMKPSNLGLGKFKYATDPEKFKELVRKGGAAVGLNSLMPPQADLSDEAIENLYAYVKSLVKK